MSQWRCEKLRDDVCGARSSGLRETIPASKGARLGFRVSCALKTLPDYWQVVEESTPPLPRRADHEWKRIVIVHDAPEERYTVDGLLWHGMIHEMRHPAQIAVLLRTEGRLDLKNYLPFA